MGRAVHSTNDNDQHNDVFDDVPVAHIDYVDHTRTHDDYLCPACGRHLPCRYHGIPERSHKHVDHDYYDRGMDDDHGDHHNDDGTFTEQYLLAWGRANVDGIAELAARTNKHRCGLWCRVNGCRHERPAFYHPDDPEYDGDDDIVDDFYDDYALVDNDDIPDYVVITDDNIAIYDNGTATYVDPNSAYLDQFHHDRIGPGNGGDPDHHNDPLVDYINDYYEGDLGRITTRSGE